MATTAGDIAFTGFNADGSDNFAIVLLSAIDGSSMPVEVIFTDNEWDGTTFNSGEGVLTWTVDTLLPAGTVVTFDNTSSSGSVTSSEGSVSLSGSLNLGASDEALFAFTGSLAAPSAFLAAITNDDFAAAGATLANTGLTAGATALELDGIDTDADIAEYIGTRTGERATLLAALNDPGNFITQDGSGDQSNDGTEPDIPFDPTSFTVTDAAGAAVTLFEEDFESFEGSGFAPTPTAGQLDSDEWRVTGLSDGDGSFGGTFTTGDFARGLDVGGGVSTGGVYAFDTGSNIIFGVQPAGSDFTPGEITLKVTNTTGSTITSLDVAYDIFFNNDQPRANSLNFAFSTDDVTYTPVSILDFTTPEASDDGFQSVGRSTTISGLNLADGADLFLQWQGDDVSGGGSRDEYGIDNILVATGSGDGSPADTTLSIVDVSQAEGDSGTTIFTFTVTRAGDTSGTTTVDFATADGTAVAGLDYTANSGTLNFAIGETTQTIAVDVVGDIDVEADETFTVTLSDPSGGATFTTDTATGTIEDDDAAPPALVINEINADPDATDGDANGDGTVNTSQDEFVEIVNIGGSVADLSGFTLSDGVGVRHTFPAATVLDPGQAIIVFGGGTPTGSFGGAIAQTASTGALGLNNGGDTITLNDGTDDIAQESYGSEGGNNQSLTRDPDLFGDFVQHSTATGANGALFSTGTQVDGTPFFDGVGTALTIVPAMADLLEGDAGTTAFTFTVNRFGDLSGATDVTFTVSGGLAAAADFGGTFPTGTVSFAADDSEEIITIDVAGDVDVEPNESFIVTLSDPTGGAALLVPLANGTILNDDIAPIPIFEIQGDGDDFTSPEFASPFNGQQVITQGVVTAIDLASDGFYIQDAVGDGNDDTSDGIFVFTDTPPTVALNSLVEVSGTVDEEFLFTRIEDVTGITVLDPNATPIVPIVLGSDRLIPTDIIDDAGSDDYDVTRDGRDFYESLEGMLVTLPDAIAVSTEVDTFAGGSVGEFTVIANQGVGATGANARGGITISGDPDPDNPIGADLNPERIQIDNDLATNSFPSSVGLGDLVGDITGVVNFAFGDYAISPLEPVVVTDIPLEPETTDLVGTNNQLTVASYNVENLDPSDPQSSFDAIAAQIVNNLQNPDIISLQEVQDNDGPGNAGDSTVTAADETLQQLVDAIVDAGGPTYEFVDNTFIGDDVNGGQPGGNIRVAFLYNPARADFVEGSDRPVGNQDPGSPFNGSRLPLAADFAFGGETVTVIGNHFTSRGGSDPLFGTTQPPAIGGEDDRIAQAEEVNAFIDAELATDPDANIVVLGDFNGFPFESFQTDTLAADGVVSDLLSLLPEEDRYTFVFDSNSQALDNILATDGLAAIAEIDAVHINAEFPEDEQASDHDPLIARFAFNAPPIANDDTATTDEATPITIDVLANDSDPDGDSLSVAAFDDSTTAGLVTDNGDGTFDYDPNGFFTFLADGESATDTFNYTVTDGSETDTALVTVTVEGPDIVTNSGTSFRFSQGTNGGANTFGFDGDAFFISGQGVGGRPKFQDFDDFLEVAAEVFDGVIESTGTINDQVLPGGNGPNILNVNDADEVIISGSGIGGSYRIQFEETGEAETFLDFVERIFDEIDANNAVATDPTDFRFDALSGARLFFDDVNDEFGFTTDGGTTQARFDTLEEFVESVATEIFGGEQLRDGNFNATRIAEGRVPNRVRVAGGDDVVIGGRSVGGQFRFDFADGGVASDFANVASTLFGNIDEANAIALGDV